MFQITLFFALFIVYNFSASAVEIPEKCRDLFPEDVATKLETLPYEEKEVLQGIVAVCTKYKDENEFLNALIQQHLNLVTKLNLLYDYISRKSYGLVPEAREFVMKVAKTIKEVRRSLRAGQEPSVEDIKKKGNERIADFDNLSDAVKEDLQKNYPIFTSVITSKKVRAMFTP
ncbi:unnamed protein product [Cylicocyclus nassatus]|uniref:Fatty-acid and retinol-binding protein 1 n=1 Tax=Cylicocyclus nassatus TaxID=53992 RepID=A0AA36M443_CYLNA|nr:unnamed protein product [Cylicocyclus nassatus]